jgi:hypothetical protein
MRASVNRAAALALATCTFSLIPFVGGCKSDIDKADEQISASVVAARQDLDAGKPDAASNKLGQNASVIRTASPGSQIESNVLLSQANLDAADQASRKLDNEENQIAAILIGMERVGGQVATNNANVGGFQALNPSDGQKAIDAAKTAAQSGEGGAWVKGTPPIPSLDDAKKREDDLKKQIDDLTKQHTQLAAKRALALEQAAKFDRDADSTTGSQSTATQIQASNQRKEATDDDIHMRDLDTQMLPLKQQLAVAQQQRESIESSVASMKDQLDKLTKGWEEGVTGQINQLKDYTKYLVNGSGAIPAGASPAVGAATTGPSNLAKPQTLQSLAAELDDHVKAAQDLRGQIIDLLTKARDANKAAGEAATSLVTDLRKRVTSPDSAKLPEKHVWQDMIALNDQAAFKLREASIYARLARLYGQQFIELAQRNSIARLVDNALKQAMIEEPPKELIALGNGAPPSAAVREPAEKIRADVLKPESADYDKAMDDLEKLAAANTTPSDQELVAAARADVYYARAESVLNEVAGGNAQGDLGQLRANLAQLARMVNNYGWYQISGLEGKSKEGKDRLSNAIAALKVLADANKALLPSPLPPELAETAGAATSQPTSQPTAEAAPTTEPAAAPTTAPAQ